MILTGKIYSLTCVVDNVHFKVLSVVRGCLVKCKFVKRFSIC